MAKLRRTLEESFLARLQEMCAKSANGRVSGSALEAELGWTVDGRYSAVRRKLIEENRIKAHAGGAGGSLQCCPTEGTNEPKPLRAFVSYSHADRPMMVELLKHLAPLTRNGLIRHWNDGEILVGKEWEKEIWSQLRSADIIILLITVDFINSEYCFDRELTAAVERHRAKKARVIPVIGRNCLWQDLPFSHIQATLNGKAVAASGDRDEALTQVAKEIKAAAEELRSFRASVS